MADWDIYLEDSGISKPNRYACIGGVMLKSGHAIRLHESIGAWRTREGIEGEIAWKKVTRDCLRSYKTFAGGAIHYINHGDMFFSCARFDRDDNQRYMRCDKIEARDKLVYQVLLHCFALRAKRDDRLFVYPDKSLIRGSTVELQRILNAGIAKHTGWRCVDMVRSIQPQESHENHFIQMSDILVGAVATANNKRHDISSSRGAAKQSLIEHVQSQSGLSLEKSTEQMRARFHLWFFTPQIKIASVSPTTSAEPRVQSDHATPNEL